MAYTQQTRGGALHYESPVFNIIDLHVVTHRGVHWAVRRVHEQGVGDDPGEETEELFLPLIYSWSSRMKYMYTISQTVSAKWKQTLQLKKTPGKTQKDI